MSGVISELEIIEEGVTYIVTTFDDDSVIITEKE